MTGLEIVTLLAQVGIPVALVGWVAVPRERSALALAVDVALAASYLALITVAGLWLALPRNLVLVFGAALTVTAILGARCVRVRGTGFGSLQVVASLVLRGTLALGVTAATLLAISGRTPEGPGPIDLEFPLRDGTYFVANGGSHPIVNFHLETLKREQARPYRGQSYAVDLVELGG